MHDISQISRSARGIYERILLLKTLIFALNEILEKTDATNTVLQSSEMDITTEVVNLYFWWGFHSQNGSSFDVDDRKLVEKYDKVEYVKVVNEFNMRHKSFGLWWRSFNATVTFKSSVLNVFFL